MEDKNKKKEKFHLDDVEKKEVFQVPAGYFDRLPAQIQQRIQDPGKGWMVFQPRVAFASVAIFCMLLTGWLGYRRLVGQGSGQQLAEIGKNVQKPSKKAAADKKVLVPSPAPNRTERNVNLDSLPDSEYSPVENASIPPKEEEALLAGIETQDILIYLNATEEDDDDTEENVL